MARPYVWILTLCGIVAFATAAAVPPNLYQALDAQRELIAQHPNDPTAFNDMGNLLVLADHFEEAEDAYQRAISLGDTHERARFNLGVLQTQTGQYKSAEATFRSLLSSAPQHAWAHYQLGVVLAQRKQRDEALEHYARALALDPRLSFAENNPHILDNELFGEALLRSQRYQPTSVSRVPRQYSEPDRIIRLMLRGESPDDLLDEMSDAAPTPDGAKRPSGLRGSTDFGDPGEAPLVGAPVTGDSARGDADRPGDGRTVGTSTGVQVGAPIDGRPSADAPQANGSRPVRPTIQTPPPPRVLSSEDLRRDGAGSKDDPRSVTPSGSTSRPRYIAPRPSTPPPPTSSRRSSAQLHLDWVPDDSLAHG